MAVLACMSVHHEHAVPLTARRGHLIPRTGIIDGYETPWECWELNPGPLEEPPVLLSLGYFSSPLT